MNTLTTIAVLAPIVNVGGSSVLSWLLTVLIIVATVLIIIWLVTKVIGPPNIPEQFRWIMWIVVAIGLLIFLFSAFGVHLP